MSRNAQVSTADFTNKVRSCWRTANQLIGFAAEGEKADRFRDKFFEELAAKYPGHSLASLQQKYANAKSAGKVLPPLPAGKRGKPRDVVGEAIAAAAVLADMADAGLAPVYGDDGRIDDWRPMTDAESEAHAAAQESVEA